MKRKIICVDDEDRVLSGLRRSLRELRESWDMHFATSGHEALEIMSQMYFDVIVSDMNMPEMSGDELLNLVKSAYPETIRIILTGAVSRENAFRMVGSEHYFLSKPCPKDVFINTIEQAVSLREMSADEARENGAVDRPPLSNEEITQVLEEFFKGQLLKETIKKIDVPPLIRNRLSDVLMTVFAPIVDEAEYVTEFLDTDEDDRMISGWIQVEE